MTGQAIFSATCALLAVLALVAVVACIARMRLPRPSPQSGRTLILKETIALDSKRRLHLVECEQRKVLLLTGGERDLVIGWVLQP